MNTAVQPTPTNIEVPTLNTNEKLMTLPKIEVKQYPEIPIKDSFKDKYKDKIIPWGFKGLGFIVYKRTYSRLKDNGEYESWADTIQRCINGAQNIGAHYTQEEAERLFDHMFNLRCVFGGRLLWQLGTSTVERFGLASLSNCWFVSMREPEDFEFLFEKLMLGGGTGFSVKREDIHELPRVKKGVNVTHELTKDADFIVPDSRQGWIGILRKTIAAFYFKGKSFTYSTYLVRGAGEPIKGFGGTASGPRVLVDGIANIVKIFQSREGKKLRSIDVLDICNIIGSIVVSGNVRRSAQIAIGDPDDYLFLRAKRWDLGNIPNWRSMSNNSIYADDYDQISNMIWEGYLGNGEPYGFINLPLSQKTGRLSEYVKDNCEGYNPCGEQSLADGEGCNLSEVFLKNIKSKEDLIDCVKLLYKGQKAIYNLPSLYEKTEKVVSKNMRLGIGVGGVCQALDKLDWLDDCYKALRKLDKSWSNKWGLPESIKLTTVKPSGTVSLLAGSTPGVHPSFDEYYIRRVRMSTTDPLIQICKDSGYRVEYVKNFDGTENHDTSIVEFPCFSKNSVLAKDMTAVKQLELVKKLQTVWSDNSVSCTVYYKKEELSEIKNWLKENYKDSIKTVSFLLHKDHGFVQSPYQSITIDEYQEAIKSLKQLSKQDLGTASLDGLECEAGVCPVK